MTIKLKNFTLTGVTDEFIEQLQATPEDEPVIDIKEFPLELLQKLFYCRPHEFNIEDFADIYSGNW